MTGPSTLRNQSLPQRRSAALVVTAPWRAVAAAAGGQRQDM